MYRQAKWARSNSKDRYSWRVIQDPKGCSNLSELWGYRNLGGAVPFWFYADGPDHEFSYRAITAALEELGKHNVGNEEALLKCVRAAMAAISSAPGKWNLSSCEETTILGMSLNDRGATVVYVGGSALSQVRRGEFIFGGPVPSTPYKTRMNHMRAPNDSLELIENEVTNTVQEHIHHLEIEAGDLLLICSRSVMKNISTLIPWHWSILRISAGRALKRIGETMRRKADSFSAIAISILDASLVNVAEASPE